MVLVSRLRLHVRLGLSLGMDALPLRQLDVRPRNGMDVAAWSMEFLAHRPALYRDVAGKFPSTRCPCDGNWEHRCGGTRWGWHCHSAIAHGSELRFRRPRDSARFIWKSKP